MFSNKTDYVSNHSLIAWIKEVEQRQHSLFVLMIPVLYLTLHLHVSADTSTTNNSSTHTQLYKIGDIGPGGGIVFYVSGDGLHGLEAAPWDQHSGIQWYNGSYTLTNASRDGVNGGKWNTERIIKNQGMGDYAAQICANFKGGGQGDWYLPSIAELHNLYMHKDIVGGFYSDEYWSSVEDGLYGAAAQYFYKDIQVIANKQYPYIRVRCIREF